MMSNQSLQQKFSYSLLLALLFSTFMLPSFQVIDGFPKIHLTDMLIPFFAMVVLINFKSELIASAKWFLIANIALMLIALISLIVNHRLFILRDDFELMKMIKFLIVFLFVIIAVKGTDLTSILKIIFVFVLFFNLLHYFNLFGFNQIITKYYGSDLQVSTFGFNSLGQPDTKRIIGTVGNPNNNAILFLFFVIFFFPEMKSKTSEKVFFLLAVFGTLACQSRTGFFALGIIFLLGSIIKKYAFKTTALYLLSFTGLFLLLLLMGNIYLNSLVGNMMKQNSLRSRLETWNILWEMIKQKPLLGYSPFKDYFYINNIYSENEYFLNAWRYGLLGLITYLMILWTSFFKAIKNCFSKSGFCLAMFTLVIAISALTNNPLSDTMIYMMFAFYAGLFFSDNIQTRRESS